MSFESIGFPGRGKKIGILGFPVGFGAGQKGSELGATAIRLADVRGGSLVSHIADLGYEVVGAAASRSHALDYVGKADIALIDLNLLDGASGLDIAKDFARTGTSVVIVTANPTAVPSDTDVAIGVLTKPVDDVSLSRTLKYLVSRIEGRAIRCPRELHLLSGAPTSED